MICQFSFGNYKAFKEEALLDLTAENITEHSESLCELPFWEESSGTRKLFTNPLENKSGSQLLFTSHDITTMSPSIFRRDEIWLCARNPQGASKLYSLSALRKANGERIRNDEQYGKRYLEGRYGADPYIQRAIDWGEYDEP